MMKGGVMKNLKSSRKMQTLIGLLYFFILPAVCLPMIFFPVSSHAQDLGAPPSFEEEDAMFWGEEDKIITATKKIRHLREAPAIATVYSAEQIRNMGARNIMDVLRRVPGIGITRGYWGHEEVEIRGIKTENSEKVKLMIDGHSVNTNWGGTFTFSFGSLSLDNVKRIEIIRGPGSALYGSNAFSGVINIITKNGSNIDGVSVTAGGGSFDTGKVNLQAGKKFGDLDVAFTFDHLTTTGENLWIDQDSMGNSGNIDNHDQFYDASLKMAYKDFSLNSKFSKRYTGANLGLTNTVQDDTKLEYQQAFVELAYKYDFTDDFSSTVKAYMDDYDHGGTVEIFSEGVIPGYPDGMIGIPTLKERTWGTEVQLDYQLFKNNQVTLGGMYERRRQFNARSKGNFNPLTGAPLGSVQDIPPWQVNKTRKVWAIYLQDVWEITNTIDLTAGFRHDDYSESGSTTNPRAGIVWKFIPDWDLKVLYGTAFRAPTFQELYNINNPAILGNTDLDPEKIRTVEISVGYEMYEDYSGRITGFHNKLKDTVKLVPTGVGTQLQYDNTKGEKVYGIELEMQKKFSVDTYVYGDYTWQYPDQRENDIRIPDVPRHRGNVGFNAGITKYFNINTNLFVSGERPRAKGDIRDPLDAYALVDLTLIAKNFYKNLEVRGMIKNLFDKDYEDPAIASVPGDLPREGISVLFDVMVRY